MRDSIVFLLLSQPQLLVFILALSLMSERLDASMYVVYAAACTVLGAWIYGATSLLRHFGLVEDVPPRAMAIVEKWCARFGMARVSAVLLKSGPPAIWLCASTRTLVVTASALRTLPDENLDALVGDQLMPSTWGSSAIGRYFSGALYLGPILLLPALVQDIQTGSRTVSPLAIAIFVGFALVSTRGASAKAAEALFWKDVHVDVMARALENLYRCGGIWHPVYVADPANPTTKTALNVYEHLTSMGEQPAYPKPRPFLTAEAMRVGIIGLATTVVAVALAHHLVHGLAP